MIQQARQLLDDLPTPPELQHAIDQTCEVCKVRPGRERQRVEEDFKLRYHFGGRSVMTVATPQGLVVYEASSADGMTLADILSRLSQSDHRTARASFPEPIDFNDFIE